MPEFDKNRKDVLDFPKSQFTKKEVLEFRKKQLETPKAWELKEGKKDFFLILNKSKLRKDKRFQKKVKDIREDMLAPEKLGLRRL